METNNYKNHFEPDYQSMLFTFENQRFVLAGLFRKFNYEEIAAEVERETSEKILNKYAHFLVTESRANLDMPTKELLMFMEFDLWGDV